MYNCVDIIDINIENMVYEAFISLENLEETHTEDHMIDALMVSR
jgi:hypothetical protein